MGNLQIVKYTNTGTEDHRITHHADTYTVRPGQTTMLPYEALASLYGDPAVRNQGNGNNARRDLYGQVRAMHNFYLGFDTEADWETKRPRFEAHDMDDRRVWFVIDDPDGSTAAALPSRLYGENITPGGSAVSTDALAKMLAELQAQMDQVRAIQSRMSGVTEATEIVNVSVNNTTTGATHTDIPSAGVDAAAGEFAIPAADPESAATDDVPGAPSLRPRPAR